MANAFGARFQLRSVRGSGAGDGNSRALATTKMWPTNWPGPERKTGPHWPRPGAASGPFEGGLAIGGRIWRLHCGYERATAARFGPGPCSLALPVARLVLVRLPCITKSPSKPR